ncbi:hypothetical protein D3C86_1621170 [compost metagenome]
MSSVPDGRAANQPPSLITLIPPSAAPLPGALSSTRVMVSPANWVLRTCSGESWLRAFFCSGVAGASTRSATISPNSSVRPRYSSPGSRPRLAVISAASKASTMPSLSVVQTLPSRRRKVAPALSSPAKPSEPSNRPPANHLKPTGTSCRGRPRRALTRSIMLLLTRVLPTAAVALHCGRCWNR